MYVSSQGLKVETGRATNYVRCSTYNSVKHSKLPKTPKVTRDQCLNTIHKSQESGHRTQKAKQPPRAMVVIYYEKA